MTSETLVPDFQQEVGKRWLSKLGVLFCFVALAVIAAGAFGYYRWQANRSIIQAVSAESVTDSQVISSAVGGTVQQILVKKGDVVKQGQLVAIISSPDLVQKYAAAENALLAAEKENNSTQALIVPPSIPSSGGFGGNFNPGPPLDLNKLKPLPSIAPTSRPIPSPPAQAVAQSATLSNAPQTGELKVLVAKAQKLADAAKDKQGLAQSDLEAAQSTLQATKGSIDSLQGEVDVATAKRDKFQGLYKDGIISRSEFQAKQNDLDNAQANITQANANIQTAQDAVNAKQAELDADDKGLATANAELAKASQEQTKFASIVSKPGPAQALPPQPKMRRYVPPPLPFSFAHHKGPLDRMRTPRMAYAAPAIAPVKVEFQPDKHMTAQMKVQAAQEQLTQITDMVKACRIVAGADGAVSDVNVLTGAKVGPQTAILTLMKPATQRVVATFDHDQALRIRYGQTCLISFDTFPHRQFKGKIARFIDGGSAKSRAKVEIIIPDRMNILSMLPPGTVSHVKVLTA